jgi:Mn2+/Fe2+ NRAMP family transporter
MANPSIPAPPFSPPVDRRSALDPAHRGDIEGALATLPAFDTGPRRSSRRKLLTLLAVLGPGVVVMVADNDAGTISVFSQAGQDHGRALLWALLLLAPALYVTQEMVARLGAVTGAGHARLTLERFGRLWCAFSLGDLLVLNLLTLVTEFIGVSLALGYFGISRYVSVPLAAAILIAVSIGGSFRRWERAMCVMVCADLLLVPLALAAHHPIGAPLISQHSPALGSPDALIVLMLALIGTTIAPWQLFFQQSMVVDKRITPRWLGYERADTAIGALLFALAAGAVMLISASAFSGSKLSGHFLNLGVVMQAVSHHIGSSAGAVFAVALLNASVLAAGAVSLSGSYAIAEVRGVKHSLHRRFSDAPVFYGSFAALIGVAAAIVLIPGLPVGAVTTFVQALTGVLLPCTLVLLLLLCNDEQLLGPRRNGPLLNLIAGSVIATIVGLSTLLTVSTTFPHLPIGIAAAVTAATMLCAGAPLAWSVFQARRSLGDTPTNPAEQSTTFTLTPWERLTWSSPALELIGAPTNSKTRTLTLLITRVYVLTITGLLLIKLSGLPVH